MKNQDSKNFQGTLSFKGIVVLWKNLSIIKKLYVIVGVMALFIIVELLTLRFAMNNLSAARAFVGSEGTWSEARRNAIYYFERYTISKNESDYLAILEALKIPEGGREARIELQKEHPNMEIIRKRLIEGKIHHEDLDATINLLRQFYWVSYISNAAQTWKEGDELLVEFKKVVEEYHQIVLSGFNNPSRNSELIKQIDRLNKQLTIKENQFAIALGEGSRRMEKLIFMILFFMVITVESLGLGLTIFTGQRISKGLSDLNRIAGEFGVGDFSRELEVKSKDEIGKLTYSINKMGALLKYSYNELRQSHQILEEKVQTRTAQLEATSDENVRLYKKAKEALVMRDEFLSIANHELRTPLTALGLQLHILNRTINSDDAANELENMREMVKRANRHLKKLSSLQNILMDLTQIQLGKFELKLEDCDLALIASECVSQLSLEASRAGSRIEFNSPAALFGKFDVIRTGQVITNLLSNAIKYGEGKPIELLLRVDRDGAVVSVSDNGPGIPLDKQAIIFERFERVTLDQSLTGLGLGLYISKQVVEAHGGALKVNSHPGKGATFIAEFPLA